MLQLNLKFLIERMLVYDLIVESPKTKKEIRQKFGFPLKTTNNILNLLLEDNYIQKVPSPVKTRTREYLYKLGSVKWKS